MARQLRYIPPRSLVEVSCRTIQGRHLLRPGSHLNEILVGILARAQSRYGVRVCEPAFLSNHYHLLLIPDNALQLALFMAYLNSNLAREAGRLHDWHARFWESRYSAIPVSDEESAQVARLMYLLSQGCKEGLVGSPLDWPGVNGIRARLTGSPLRGIWIDRTAEYRARRRRRSVDPSAFIHEEVLELAALPCWAHLDTSRYRSNYAALVHRVEADARGLARDTGRGPAGAEAVMRTDPHFRPNRMKRGAIPRIHASSRAARRRFHKAYAAFAAAFRLASERLRAGVRNVRFPEGSFPPSLGYVADIAG